MDNRGILDDMDTSTPFETPTDAEDIAQAEGRGTQPVSIGAKVMIALITGFFLMVFALTFYIYFAGGNQQNLLQAALDPGTPVPENATGTERINAVVVPGSIQIVQSSTQRQAMVTPTKVPSATPIPNATVVPYEITVTDYYTGANLKVRIKDNVGAVPTPQGGGTPEPSLTAPIQTVTLRFVFYNTDKTSVGNWVANFGPIPLNGEKEFDVKIPSKPGLGNWDGKGSVQVITYAILSQPNQ